MRLPDSNRHAARQQCRQTRLAEGGVAAIDLCECGVVQIHVGAVTLRMAPCALGEFIATLERAVAERAALQEADPASEAPPLLGRGNRGQA